MTSPRICVPLQCLPASASLSVQLPVLPQGGGSHGQFPPGPSGIIPESLDGTSAACQLWWEHSGLGGSWSCSEHGKVTPEALAPRTSTWCKTVSCRVLTCPTGTGHVATCCSGSCRPLPAFASPLAVLVHWLWFPTTHSSTRPILTSANLCKRRQKNQNHPAAHRLQSTGPARPPSTAPTHSGPAPQPHWGPCCSLSLLGPPRSSLPSPRPLALSLLLLIPTLCSLITFIPSYRTLCGHPSGMWTLSRSPCAIIGFRMLWFWKVPDTCLLSE